MLDNFRLVIAMALSFVVMLLWQLIFPTEKPLYNNNTQHPSEQIKENNFNTVDAQERMINEYVNEYPATSEIITKDHSLKQRIKIESEYLSGSINLKGALIDDMLLKKYEASQTSDMGKVRLLSPKNSANPYFISFGWLIQDYATTPETFHKTIDLPNQNTLWQSSHNVITPGETIDLTWTNAQNIKFVISITLDAKYMFNIKQSVLHNLQDQLLVKEYVIMNRMNNNEGEGQFVSHQGVAGVINNNLKEITFEDFADEKKFRFKDNVSWFGFSDKYWLVAAIAMHNNNSLDIQGTSYKSNTNAKQRYQISMLNPAMRTLKNNKESTTSYRLFIGAKELDLLKDYSKFYNITLFDRAVDFGLIYFITKPLFELLTYFYHLIGNFGLAIILLTIFVKILLFPLAYKGFKSMNKLKDLQPKILKLRELYKSQPSVMQKATMKLYKDEKVNPVSGCLPIILQMPVFFALYKVLYVTIEMRHAHFFGWLTDLSAQDPSNIFNLFGLVPWNTPQFLTIGILPLLMGITMYIQQTMSPQPADATQATVMKILPLVLIFVFASFPSGLVLYWVCSNLLSIFQQYIIKKIN